MGAQSKRARKVRSAAEFDTSRLSYEIRRPRGAEGSVYSWALADIFQARDAQMHGNFRLPARLAESMRTDDALQVAYENRLAPLRCLKVELEPAKGARGASIAAEADASFGQNGVGIHPDSIADIDGCLVNHGVAFGVCVATPREDGSRVDFELKSWPIEFVRWDPFYRCFVTLVDPESMPENEVSKADIAANTYGFVGGYQTPIVHGDGRWVVFKKHEIYPWREEAALLSAALVWARHAFAIRDWAKGSVAHGNAKVVGEMPAGVALNDANGNLTPDAAAFLELLRAMQSADSPIGIRPAGSKTDYVTNNSNAWQVWNELVQNAEKAAARIYLGTDGTLGTQGGAPGVDIGSLFGVATTKVEGDVGAIERGIQTGVIEPWTAVNFGDSTLAPYRRYMLPDSDADALKDSLSKRSAAFHLDLKTMHEAGLLITQEYANGLAADYGVRAPTIAIAPVVAKGDPASAPAVTAPAAPAALRLVPPVVVAKAEPTAIEKTEHASRMTAALLADIREARSLGLEFSQDQINENAKRYGVPAPRVESK